MKDWHIKPYHARRHRLAFHLRQYHFENIKSRSTEMDYTEMKKSISAIETLSKKIP